MIGCKKQGWSREPDSFMGVKLGVPLEQSVHKCPENHVTEPVCYRNDGIMIFLENVPHFEMVTVSTVGGKIDGKVGRVDAYSSHPDPEATLNALIEKFGRPGYLDHVGGHDKDGNATTDTRASWLGKKVLLRYSSGDGPGELVSATTKEYGDYAKAKANKRKDQIKDSF
jgi:hypothetical protein